MYSQSDAHTMKLLELPLMLRLKQNAIVLHSELGLTEDGRGQNSALLSSIVFPRGLHTLVSQLDDKDVVGQFRLSPAARVNAHIVCLAPTLDEDEDDSDLATHARCDGRAGRQAMALILWWARLELSHRLI